MTITIPFVVNGRIGPLQKEVLRRAVSSAFPDDAVAFRPAEAPGPGVLGFGVESGVTTLHPRDILRRPFSERYLAVALRKVAAWPSDLVPEKP